MLNDLERWRRKVWSVSLRLGTGMMRPGTVRQLRIMETRKLAACVVHGHSSHFRPLSPSLQRCQSLQRKYWSRRRLGSLRFLFLQFVASLSAAAAYVSPLR
jgi:hypothetical protein